MSLLVVTAGLSLLLTAQAAEYEYEVFEDLMQTYHKAPEGVDSVTKKIGNGQATEEEIARVLEGYLAISEMEPPEGELDSWAEKTGIVISALKGIQEGKEGSTELFQEAVNCKACHNLHKG